MYAPTAQGFTVNVVLSAGDPSSLRLRLQRDGLDQSWIERQAPESRAPDLAEWTIEGLEPGTRYVYQVLRDHDCVTDTVYIGHAVTARAEGTPFSFALLSDTHIGANLAFTNQGDPTTLAAVSEQIAAASPDFMVNLGDTLDFHQYGFNDPPPDGSITKSAYLNYRATLGDTLGNLSHFSVIGGWDSENGCNTVDEINRSRDERLLYQPGPSPETYPQGGSPFEDYYAFTWGDALFVVLNVYTYTPGCHLLSTYPGLPDDWTLGGTQLEWLRQTLANATSKWRFLLIHHPVGGAAGDDINSAYGRGGGQAAYVGEQAMIHQLMIDYGVQAFFYGHDHVFTDMVVDGIRYSLPGSAGAPWLFSQAETGYTQYWAESGWARVDVSPTAVGVHFIDRDGAVIYEYTLN